MTTLWQPQYFPANGSLYVVDRAETDGVSWYRDLYGPGRIPSAPRSLSVALVDHGDGHAYGHDKHVVTPEPSAFWCLVAAMALLVVSRIMAWRQG